MKSIVVYESFYGNTESIATAIAEGLARHGEARAIRVSDVDVSLLSDADLLIVGAPTHAWGLPRAKTRASVDTSAADPSRPLVRDWLAKLPAGDGRPAAAFATRLNNPRLLTGSAATGIARRLRRRGWRLVSRPKSFVVTGTPGPLAPGEAEKAKAWGDELAVGLAPTPSSRR
jgi:Flavodoxin